MTPFSLRLPVVGSPEVTVGGVPVPDVCSVAVKAEAGEATKLYLTLNGDGTITGDGIVHVVRDAPHGAVVDWLSQVDPDELEKAALDRMGGLGGGTTGEAVLDVLRGWAGGGT